MEVQDYRRLQNGSDIRGVALAGVPNETVNLTSDVARAFACAFTAWLAQAAGHPAKSLTVAVGRDSRLSGPALAEAVEEGLRSMGVRVARCGLASTPAMFMSTVLPGYGFDGAVMITASHLPYNRNGLKFFTAEGGFGADQIAALCGLAGAGGFKASQTPGGVFEPPLMRDYAAHLVDVVRRGADDPNDRDHPLHGLHILVDAGNGAGGFFASQVLAPLGADTSGSQFLEPDGSFPNHIPNPENETAMQSVRGAVLQNKADLGVIFDTDVDRAGAVDASGEEINRNRLIALMSSIVLREHPGTTIVTDSVTSDELTDFIRSLGGIHHRFRRGYRNVIDESVRLNRAGRESWLAMETSGHGALRENYFLDDGAYLMAKILIETARCRRAGVTVASLVASLGEPEEAAEFRFAIREPDFKAYGARVLDELKTCAAADPAFHVASENYEGLRASFGPGEGDGWFLLRMSLHDPVMPLNIESRAQGGVRQIASRLRKCLVRFPGLDLTPIEKI